MLCLGVRPRAALSFELGSTHDLAAAIRKPLTEPAVAHGISHFGGAESTDDVDGYVSDEGADYNGCPTRESFSRRGVPIMPFNLSAWAP